MRFLDIFISVFGLILLAPLVCLVWIVLFVLEGSPIFKQIRVGVQGRYFTIFKFRTMRVDTKSLATHLIDSSNITVVGRFLRASKLDEIPQLWNVLKGDMSLVGPRPCLPNQIELIAERRRRGVLELHPGITGLAQIHGIDMSIPRLLARVDALMVRSDGLKFRLYIIMRTILKIFSLDRRALVSNQFRRRFR